MLAHLHFFFLLSVLQQKWPWENACILPCMESTSYFHTEEMKIICLQEWNICRDKSQHVSNEWRLITTAPSVKWQAVSSSISFILQAKCYHQKRGLTSEKEQDFLKGPNVTSVEHDICTLLQLICANLPTSCPAFIYHFLPDLTTFQQHSSRTHCDFFPLVSSTAALVCPVQYSLFKIPS